jgi:uncharacterized membrane protein
MLKESLTAERHKRKSNRSKESNMANSNQIATGIIKAYFGIIGIGILVSLVLCVFMVLCMLIFASQVKVTTGPGYHIP